MKLFSFKFRVRFSSKIPNAIYFKTVSANNRDEAMVQAISYLDNLRSKYDGTISLIYPSLKCSVSLDINIYNFTLKNRYVCREKLSNSIVVIYAQTRSQAKYYAINKYGKHNINLYSLSLVGKTYCTENDLPISQYLSKLNGGN